MGSINSLFIASPSLHSSGFGGAFLVYREKENRVWGKVENEAEKAVPLHRDSRVNRTHDSVRTQRQVRTK